MECMKYFGGLIRRYRQENGITQERFAEKCQLSAREISNIEAGRTEPKFGSGLRICIECRIDINQFAQQYRREYTGEDI